MRLALEVDRQLGPCLCWAAVASSLARYYGTSASSDQREFVIECLGAFGWGPHCPVAAMERAGVWRATLDRALLRDEIAAELREGRPVVVQLALGFGGNHLVVVSGLDADRLWVHDPRHGDDWVPYGLLVEAPWTRWTRSLLTGRSRDARGPA